MPRPDQKARERFAVHCMIAFIGGCREARGGLLDGYAIRRVLG